MQRKYKRFDVLNTQWNALSGAVLKEMKKKNPEMKFGKVELLELEKATHAGFRQHLEELASNQPASAPGAGGTDAPIDLKLEKLGEVEPKACVFVESRSAAAGKPFGKMLMDIVNNRGCRKEGAYLVGVSGIPADAASSVIQLPHAMAMRQTATELHFMDPNWGEFKFELRPDESVVGDSDLGRFLDRMSELYGKQKFVSETVFEYGKTVN
ncbi:hypothetical protein DRW03_08760 [Corallococcus sp. H22C18031201]|nr:hypothetical protein DRW03_08760 [Corallococcus sp. H22C18031201]